VSAAAILRDAAADGVEVALRDGRLAAVGTDAAVNRWLSELRAVKEQVINLLRWATDEAAIRRWLAVIGEDDERVIEETVLCCKTDEPSRTWALDEALKVLKTTEDAEDAHTILLSTFSKVEHLQSNLTEVASCKRCRHVTRYVNCGDPIGARLSDRFVLVAHPSDGRGCRHFELGDLQRQVSELEAANASRITR
jgi:hypothetical protein